VREFGGPIKEEEIRRLETITGGRRNFYKIACNSESENGRKRQKERPRKIWTERVEDDQKMMEITR